MPTQRGWHIAVPQLMLVGRMTLVCCAVPEVLEFFIDLGITVLSSKLHHVLRVPSVLSQKFTNPPYTK